MKRFAQFLDRLNESHQPLEAQSPIATSAIACLLSFVFIYWLDGPQVSSLRLWWAELFVYAAIPIILAFIILTRSAWHHELARIVRLPLLALMSCAIFGGVLLATGLALGLLCLVYFSSMDNFATGHF